MERGKQLYAWGAAVLIFVVLMVVTPAIPQSEEYHNFADQRELFLGERRIRLRVSIPV